MALNQSSKSFISRQAKMQRLISRLALVIAAKQNPSGYAKYQAIRKKYLMAKMALIRQNASKATAAARQLLMNAGK